MVAEADGARWRRRGDRVVVLLDVVDGCYQLIRLAGERSVQAGEQILGGDQAQIPAGSRDGDGRGQRSGDLGGRHGDVCCGDGGGGVG